MQNSSGSNPDVAHIPYQTIRGDIQEEARTDTSNVSVFRVLAFSACYGAFLIPSAYALPSIVFRAWQFWYLIVGAISIVLVLANCRIGFRWVGFVCFYLFYYVASTIVADSDGGLMAAGMYAMRGIGFASLLEYSLGRNRREAMLAFIVAGVVMCAANYVTYLMYRDIAGGMRYGYVEYYQSTATTQHWFLFTHDNGSIFFYIPVIVVLWFYASAYRSKSVGITAVVFSAATIYMYVDLWAVTAMVVTGATVTVMAVLSFHKLGRMFTGPRLRTVFLLCALAAILIVLFSMSDIVQNAAAYFGKTRTLNIRVSIWQKSIEWFLNNPLFGNGHEDNYTTYLKIGINHSHNFVLDILYSGGLSAAVAFVAGYLACGRTDANRTSCQGTVLLLTGIAACFAAGCFDWYAYMVAPLALPYFYSFVTTGEDASELHAFGQAVIPNERRHHH